MEGWCVEGWRVEGWCMRDGVWRDGVWRDGVWRTVYMFIYGVWKDGEIYTHNECLRLLIHHTSSPVHVPCVVGSVQRGKRRRAGVISK